MDVTWEIQVQIWMIHLGSRLWFQQVPPANKYIRMNTLTLRQRNTCSSMVREDNRVKSHNGGGGVYGEGILILASWGNILSGYVRISHNIHMFYIHLYREYQAIIKLKLFDVHIMFHL